MALFQKLLNLHTGVTPEENFFTEVFVAVLSRNKELHSEFVRRFLGISDKYYSYRIESQVSLPILPEHDMGSRPDVLIQLFTDEPAVYDLILIESKLGSSEGRNQLSRYADHLAETFSNARKRYLLYITRYYDPKAAPDIVGKMGDSVKFIQIRWNQIYVLLNNFRQDALVDEMAIFMEDNGMAEITQLLPGDLFAITAFPRVMDFMLNSMDGELKKKFSSILGVSPYPLKDMVDNLRSNRRFMLYAYLGKNWWVGLGYFFDPDGKTNFPSLRLNIEINSKATRWQELATVFKEILSEPPSPMFAWSSYNLEKPQSWAGIYIQESLNSVVAESDHLHIIKNKFNLYLDQVALIKQKYPSLPWVSG